MAIVKNTVKASRLERDVLPSSRDGFSSQDDDGGDDIDGYDDEVQSQSLDTESDDTDVSEVDSGMRPGDYDLSELSDAGSEYCQVGNQSFGIPLELYELPNLSSILSLETWNTSLTEEERSVLAEYLPDMDQEAFAQTLKELFSGSNFHFGNPVVKLFNQLKGGLCEPRVNLYRHCWTFLQRYQHYHRLQKYQNSMVDSLIWMRDAWENYAGYGIEERLRLLNILNSQRPSGHMKNDDRGSSTDSENDEYGDNYWKKRLTVGRWSDPLKVESNSVFNEGDVTLDVAKRGKEQFKGMLKIAGTKAQKGDYSRTAGRPQLLRKLETKHRPSGSSVAPPSQYTPGLDSGSNRNIIIQMKGLDNDKGEQVDDVIVRKTRKTKKTVHAIQLAKVASDNQQSFDKFEQGTYTGWNSPDKDCLQNVMPKGSRTSKLAGNSRLILTTTRVKGHKSPPSSEMYHDSSHGVKNSLIKPTQRSSQNRTDVKPTVAMFDKNVETELSEQEREEEYATTSDRKFRCPIPSFEKHQSEAVKTASASKLKRQAKKSSRESSLHHDQELSSKVKETIAFSSKAKHKSRPVGISLQTLPAKLSGEQENGNGLMKKGKSEANQSGRLDSTVSKVHSSKSKRRQAMDLHSLQQENDGQEYENGILDAEEDFGGRIKTVDGKDKSSNSGQITENTVSGVDFHENLNMTLTECNLVTKRRRGEADDGYFVEPVEAVEVQPSPKRQTNDYILVKKKAKRRSLSSSGCMSASTDAIVLDKEPTDVQPEPEVLPTKKTFTLITPTVHTGFSFSVIHLLSAIRKAMITPDAEDAMEIDYVSERKVARHTPLSEDSKIVASPSLNIEGGPGERKHLPSLTVQDIVSRVRTNPGDPCILETQEPLQDLVRGVLKIFSSKTAPLGAKGWKVLVFYEKSTKCWTWIGPVPSILSDHDVAEEETSSEAWGLPHKMLVKLVDAFANWLKAGQETLKQIGSLPAPPVMMLPNFDEKERFKDLRAQKSLVTICPSSEEVKTYFRREEFLRYSVPDRAFAYTATDGKKTTVAPLRRGGGKPTSKARDHFMLKPDRPPHVTILCLVRDAAARLPGSIGTRADVCTLIRDSRYLVEDVSDAQINSVVSGALDRLHYEQDPCVQFDGERKLWVYLHRLREEEDFEDDGTSTTKKWKRPRRDAADNDQTTDLGCTIVEDQDGFYSNPNVNPASTYVEKPELFCGDLRSGMQDIEPLIDSMQNGVHQEHPMGWEVMGNECIAGEPRAMSREFCNR